MTTATPPQPWLAQFQQMRPYLTLLVGRFCDSPDAVMSDAAIRFEAMLEDLAYRDNPDNPMANPLVICTSHLAVHLALQAHGVSAHDYGSAMLDAMTQLEQLGDIAGPEDDLAGFAQLAEASQQHGKAGEFVFEFIPGDGAQDWGYNITSCAICHQFRKFDAMDLVPYMCASDDVMSDKANQGLRRSGTIALGAHKCDFRYGPNNPPARVAEQFPDRIRWVEQPAS
ncbi:MAG: L-2-amino-thiazoline-4-carboxylic acid hydrolase [Pseudomonadales bacterium]